MRHAGNVGRLPGQPLISKQIGERNLDSTGDPLPVEQGITTGHAVQP
jgi:hypothetical protein